VSRSHPISTTAAAWLIAGLSGLLCGQDALHQWEARAAELKSKGDAPGSLAAWKEAARLAPGSALIAATHLRGPIELYPDLLTVTRGAA